MNRIMLAEMRLPFPPSVNHIWQKDPHGMHLSEDVRRYVSQVKQLALLNGQGDTEYFLRVSMEPEPKQRLMVRASFFCPDNRKRDLDNLFKAVFDCLTKAGIWPDDSQVFEIKAKKYLKRDYTKNHTAGRAELEIYGDFE